MNWPVASTENVDVRVTVSCTGTEEPVIAVNYGTGELRMDTESAEGLAVLISDAVRKAKLLRAP